MAQRLFGFMRGNQQIHGHEAKMAALKFDTDEIHVLRKTWQDLADRSSGKGIDKETFLQYFPLNGLLGERLFAQFDKRGVGEIDFEEFITGLAQVCRGSIDDKIHFLFNMYDLSHQNTVSKAELSTLLNHIPKEAFYGYNMASPVSSSQAQMLQRQPSITGDNAAAGSVDGDDLDHFALADQHVEYEPSYDEGEEFDHYTNHDIVEKAFRECDLNHEGRLSYEQFKMWVQRTPMIMDYIDSILPYNGPKDLHPHHHKKDTLPHMKRMASMRASLGRSGSIYDPSGDIFNPSGHLPRRMSGSHPSLNTMGTSRPRSATSGPSSIQAFANSGLNWSGSSLAYTPEANSPVPPQVQGFSRNSSFDTVSAHGQMFLKTPTPPPSGNGGIAANNRFSVSSVRANELGGPTNTEEEVQYLLLQAIDLTQNESLRHGLQKLMEVEFNGLVRFDRADSAEIYRTVVSMEGFLWKKGKALHLLGKRYYLLSGNCMYYYNHKNDIRPKGVVFLMGSIIEKLRDDDMEIKGYYGFEILHQDLCTGKHHLHEKRVLFCKSEAEREKWVTTLQHSAHVVPIEDDYVISKELGRGRFSVVCECVHKVTGEHCAVKIIDKATIEPEEKGLLRSEIAVLKLVNHPNIIRMEGLYESKNHIYIVMEMLKGGELFERIVGRPRFTELEAARLLRPLLESVAYLHDLGIVHRDLKPENILCGKDLDDIKIADFGLSKMVLPKEKMDSACGTLSYVAPEVLTMQGYGKEADLWSVGVIMFLLLCGKLPFDGEDHNEIIRSTIQADLKVNPAVWSKLSEEAKNLLTSFLSKNPRDRISARDALRHPFIVNLAGSSRRSLLSTSDVSATTPRLSQAKSVKNTGSIPTSDLSPAIADPTNNTKAFTFRNVDGVETDDSLTPPSSTPRESHQSEQVSELKVDV